MPARSNRSSWAFFDAENEAVVMLMPTPLVPSWTLTRTPPYSACKRLMSGVARGRTVLSMMTGVMLPMA